jgi:FkbM family methyltransferase
MKYNESEFKTPWGANVKVFCREDTNDWNTLYSCITEDEYLVADLDNSNSDVCVDIGAHAGGCTLALLSRGFKVIAVEPLPENTELIMKNVEANGWSNNLTLYKKAISDISGKSVVLRYGNEKTESGAHHRFIGNTIDSSEWQENLWTQGREIKVDTISIDDMLKNVSSVNLLKIDCEGAEWSAFSKVSSVSLAKIKNIVAELHGIPSTKNMYQEFNDLIGSNFKDVTSTKFKDINNYPTIGLAYFTK